MAEITPQGVESSPAPAPDSRPRRAIALRPLWIASVALLSLAAAGVGAYLLSREPVVVERTLSPPPPQPPSPETARRADALRALNDALEGKISDLRKQIETPQCPPGTELDPAAATGKAAFEGFSDPGNSPASGLAANSSPRATPEGSQAGADQASLTPPPLDDAHNPVKPLSSAQLSALLERATALVLTRDSTATGFFVADQLLVTNRHAVEGADAGRVFIASASLGHVRLGQVMAASPPGPTGSPDFALVRLQDARAPGTLPLTGSFSKLMSVVAAGYPGFSMEMDEGFRRLISGDAAAAPDLNVTTGTVQAIQKTPQGLSAIVHEASVLKGNSGGPLVDRCGRVIGINTFIAVDQTQSARNNYALAATDLATFLKSAKAPIPLDPRPCMAV